MKAIAIFSGKGGVGKSTIAALLSLALAKKHKVVLLDVDINTPSIPVMLRGKRKIGNLHFISIGLHGSGKALTFTGKTAKQVVKSLVNNTLKIKPDICILDLPPGTGDVQMTMCSEVKPSAAILVMQPNKLCEEDGVRATELFNVYKVPILGVIENMTGEVFGKGKKKGILNLPVLKTLKLDKEIAIAGSSGKIHKIEKNPLDSIAEEIFQKAFEVPWKIVRKEMFEGPSYEELLHSGIFDKAGAKYDPKYQLYKFYGLKSWDEMRGMIRQHNVFPDRFLEENDAIRIRGMLKGLDDTNNGMFTIIQAPNTEVKLFPGESGMAHLYLSGKGYYDVPRIAYETDKGPVVLFPHEVTPTTTKDILSSQKINELVRIPSSTTPRWVPTPWVMEQIANSFGTWVGATQDWKERYKELGIIGG